MSWGSEVVGWWFLKRFHRSKFRILWDKVDIYRTLLEPKNLGPYFIKLRALWPSRPINKVKNQYPQNAPKMNFYYEISIWMAPTWQPFEDLLAKMFLKPSLKLAAKCHCSRYVAKQRGLAALILLSKVVGFFGSKVSYICLLYPTGCDICSDEIFLKTTTLLSYP